MSPAGARDRKFNATTHGAQSQPGREEVVAHLSAILGGARGLGDTDLECPRGLAALQLAVCEARLDRAQAHYLSVLPEERDAECDHMMEHVEDVLYFSGAGAELEREATRRLRGLDRLSHDTVARRKRLAGRYLREAQAERGRALEAYLEFL